MRSLKHRMSHTIFLMDTLLLLTLVMHLMGKRFRARQTSDSIIGELWLMVQGILARLILQGSTGGQLAIRVTICSRMVS